MRKLILGFIFAITLLPQINAQVPGYLGRKFSLNFNYQGFITRAELKPATASQTGSVGWGSTLNVSAEMTISRKMVLLVGYRRLYSAIKVHNEIDGSGNPVLGSLGVVGNGFSFGFKKFSRKGLAPLGSYIRVEGMLMPYSVTNPNNYYYSWADNQKKITSGFTVGLLVGAGINYIVADRIILNAAMQYGLVFPPLSTPDNFGAAERVNTDVTYYGAINVKQRLESEASNRIFNQMFINIEVGVGVLLF